MIVDLTKPFLDLGGKEVPDQNISQLVANILATDNKHSDPIKLTRIAKELYTTGKCNVDESDRKLLESFIQSSQSLTAIAKDHLLSALEDAKATKEA